MTTRLLTATDLSVTFRQEAAEIRAVIKAKVPWSKVSPRRKPAFASPHPTGSLVLETTWPCSALMIFA